MPDHPRSRGVYGTHFRFLSVAVGSSPLARGLLSITRAHRAAGGIIPARAGFTPIQTTQLGDIEDHPRSRGVYAENLRARAGEGGSSPLARGLQSELLRDGVRRRIIPARAGFTTVSDRPHTKPADHPRSRGVYVGISNLPTFSVRIIPARAGFTTPGPGVRGRSGDHPRSRGVYDSGPRTGAGSYGSSPLARGLQRIRAHRGDLLGIIPARAGFTWRSPSAPRQSPDHPRSRGVYAEEMRARAGEGGSSPLARGLRSSSRTGKRPARIIPARAGFTIRKSLGSFMTRDHPRSRGVYRHPCTGGGVREGSSPLARGLQMYALYSKPRDGIIPARAGFTYRIVRPVRQSEDHPRSRGVYPHRILPPNRHRGSSPLARGLRTWYLMMKYLGGIIPARAGFTFH